MMNQDDMVQIITSDGANTSIAPYCFNGITLDDALAQALVFYEAPWEHSLPLNQVADIILHDI